MADTNSFVGEAYNIPYGGIGSGEAMQYTANRQLQDQQARQSEQAKAAKEQQDLLQGNRVKNVDNILSATEFNPFSLGERSFDEYSHNALNEIRDKALKDYAEFSPAETQMRIVNDMKEFIQWHSAAKNTLKKNAQNATEFNKTIPNTDLNKINQYVSGNMVNDFLEKDANGEWKRKDYRTIPEKNYFENFNDPETVAGFVNDESPLQKYYDAVKVDKVTDLEYKKTGKGASKSVSWTAPIARGVTDIEKNEKGEIVYDTDGRPKIDVLNEKIKVDGKEIKLLSEEVYSNMPPAAKAALASRWMAEKPKLEAKLNRKIEGAEAKMMFMGFAYQDAKQRLNPQASFAEKVVEPKIVVNTGTGSGSKGGKRNDTTDFVLRVKEAQNSGDPTKVVETLKELMAGNGNLELVENEKNPIRVNAKDGGFTVYYHPKVNGFVDKSTTLNKSFKFNDPDAYYKLGGFFQEATGSSARLENNIFSGKGDYTNPKAKQAAPKAPAKSKSGRIIKKTEDFINS